MKLSKSEITTLKTTCVCGAPLVNGRCQDYKNHQGLLPLSAFYYLSKMCPDRFEDAAREWLGPLAH